MPSQGLVRLSLAKYTVYLPTYLYTYSTYLPAYQATTVVRPPTCARVRFMSILDTVPYALCQTISTAGAYAKYSKQRQVWQCAHLPFPAVLYNETCHFSTSASGCGLEPSRSCTTFAHFSCPQRNEHVRGHGTAGVKVGEDCTTLLPLSETSIATDDR